MGSRTCRQGGVHDHSPKVLESFAAHTVNGVVWFRTAPFCQICREVLDVDNPKRSTFISPWASKTMGCDNADAGTSTPFAAKVDT